MRTKIKEPRTSGNQYGDQSYNVIGTFTITHTRNGKDDMRGDVERVLNAVKKAHNAKPWTDNDGYQEMHRLCPRGKCIGLDGSTDGKISIATIIVEVLPPNDLVWSQLHAFKNYLETLGVEMKRICNGIKKVTLTLNFSSSVTILD